MSRAIESVIGLEMHVQLKTASKIFCACPTDFGAPPNTQVCPICLGYPGVLPVMNRKAAALAVRFGLAVGAKVNEESVFARKNYFYPDLPKGYQITQYEIPIVVGGEISYRLHGATRTLALTRAHLEEDAGKSTHPDFSTDRVSLIDLNRAGVPLLEIVTEPDLRTPEEAHAVLLRARQIIRYLEIGDGNMEEGSLRCDANISVRYAGETQLNPKTEIKNLNSFRNVERALHWEINRQTAMLEDKEPMIQATRLWDADAGRTQVMRTKEDADDYRYFPEPDLPPLRLTPEMFEEEQQSLPELPWEKELRYTAELGLSEADTLVLTADPELAQYFEAAFVVSKEAKLTANWVMTEVMRLIKEGDHHPEHLKVRARELGELVAMISKGDISSAIGKQVFEIMAKGGGSPAEVVDAHNLKPIGDEDALGKTADEIIEENPGPLKQYLAGKESTLQFFVGQMMRKTKGRADPVTARELFKTKLEEKRS